MADRGFFAGDGRVHPHYRQPDSMVGHQKNAAAHTGHLPAGLADLRVCARVSAVDCGAHGAGGVGRVLRPPAVQRRDGDLPAAKTRHGHGRDYHDVYRRPRAGAHAVGHHHRPHPLAFPVRPHHSIHAGRHAAGDEILEREPNHRYAPENRCFVGYIVRARTGYAGAISLRCRCLHSPPCLPHRWG